MSLGTVYWEEETRQREVTHICERCQASWSQDDHTRRITELADVWIVSPSGIGHIQHENRLEDTLCGIDATGKDWWWRL